MTHNVSTSNIGGSKNPVRNLTQIIPPISLARVRVHSDTVYILYKALTELSETA
jgi:hypothetical protein